MGEQATLADAQVVGQALKGDGVEAFGRADSGRVGEDGLAGAQATDTAAVGRLLDGEVVPLGFRCEPDFSTNGRLLLTLNDRSCYLFE
jgi:hypothetical protein